MRRLGITICVVLLAAVGACADDDDKGAGAASDPPSSPTSDRPSSPASSSASAAADLLPEGVYRTAPLTADDIRAAAAAGGFTEAEAAVVTDLFEDSVVWELTLGGGRWTEAEIYDGAPAEVGWHGSYTIDDDHTVTATEDGAGPITYEFTVVGDQLTLKLAPGQSKDDRDNLLHQTVIYESAPFVLQGGTGAEATQSVDEFVVPFTIELADWLVPEPSQKSETFVTWEAFDHGRGLRVMSPVEVYRPGETEPSAPPADLASYLTSLADVGAEVTDVAETEVDGQPATEMTLTLGPGTQPGSLDGAIGCPDTGQSRDSCFGPQDDLSLRLVVADVHGTPILVWERDPRDDADASADGTFDAMVASIRFH